MNNYTQGFYAGYMSKKALDLDLEVGDIVLSGRFKNKRTEVKKLGTDDLGQPTFNGQKLLTVRIEKTLPADKQSRKTRMSKEGFYAGYMHKEAEKEFAWVYVPIEGDVRDEFKKFTNRIADDDLYTGDEEGDNKYGREDDPHITVLYGIHDNVVDQIKDTLKDQAPAYADIAGISTFENDDYTVLKFDITSPDLTRINKALQDSSIEITNTHPKYHAHATIAYLKKGVDPKKYVQMNSRLTGKRLYWDYVVFGDLEDEDHKITLTGSEKKASDIIPGGLADDTDPATFNQAALKKGIDVELEHTSSREIAREIAMDHLTEDPAYYDKLETIE